jgi:DNA-binding MarR family transcriptional regulator
LFDGLVANGWVERRTQPGDRRVKRVYLTVEAERVHKRIWRVAEATVDTALADLSARESKQLFVLLQRVKQTLVSGADGPAKGAGIAGRSSALRGTRRANGRIAP